MKASEYKAYVKKRKAKNKVWIEKGKKIRKRLQKLEKDMDKEYNRLLKGGK